MQLLKIGDIEIEVTFKDIKNLHLSVHPPLGKVTISSPDFYDLEKVKIYAATKLAWIKKERKKFLEQKRQSPRNYITRESHYLFGERYLLQVETASQNKVSIEGKKIVLHCTEVEDLVLKSRLVEQFYRKELRKKLKEWVQVHSKRMNIEVPSFKIRKMKTKWGSCATENQTLWFNLELAKKPIECIEYVVVHELVHFLERHHNNRFIGFMDQYLPNWRIQKQLLNELPV